MGAVNKKKSSNVNVTNKVQRFLKGVWSELKKVHWPSRRELVVYTGVVLAATLFVAALIWVVDSLFSLLFSFFR